MDRKTQREIEEAKKLAQQQMDHINRLIREAEEQSCCPSPQPPCPFSPQRQTPPEYRDQQGPPAQGDLMYFEDARIDPLSNFQCFDQPQPQRPIGQLLRGLRTGPRTPPKPLTPLQEKTRESERKIRALYQNDEPRVPYDANYASPYSEPPPEIEWPHDWFGVGEIRCPWLEDEAIEEFDPYYQHSNSPQAQEQCLPCSPSRDPPPRGQSRSSPRSPKSRSSSPARPSLSPRTQTPSPGSQPQQGGSQLPPYTCPQQYFQSVRNRYLTSEESPPCSPPPSPRSRSPPSRCPTAGGGESSSSPRSTSPRSACPQGITSGESSSSPRSTSPRSACPRGITTPPGSPAMASAPACPRTQSPPQSPCQPPPQSPPCQPPSPQSKPVFNAASPEEYFRSMRSHFRVEEEDQNVCSPRSPTSPGVRTPRRSTSPTPPGSPTMASATACPRTQSPPQTPCQPPPQSPPCQPPPQSPPCQPPSPPSTPAFNAASPEEYFRSMRSHFRVGEADQNVCSPRSPTSPGARTPRRSTSPGSPPAVVDWSQANYDTINPYEYDPYSVAGYSPQVSPVQEVHPIDELVESDVNDEYYRRANLDPAAYRVRAHPDRWSNRTAWDKVPWVPGHRLPSRMRTAAPVEEDPIREYLETDCLDEFQHRLNEPQSPSHSSSPGSLRGTSPPTQQNLGRGQPSTSTQNQNTEMQLASNVSDIIQQTRARLDAAMRNTYGESLDEALNKKC